jgi:hypothetical protein
MRYEGYGWDPTKGPASIHRARAALDQDGSEGFPRIDIDSNERNLACSLAGSCWAEVVAGVWCARRSLRLGQ